jgi:hypothetical protein
VVRHSDLSQQSRTTSRHGPERLDDLLLHRDTVFLQIGLL